jgi:hypothetical protein
MGLILLQIIFAAAERFPFAEDEICLYRIRTSPAFGGMIAPKGPCIKSAKADLMER